MFPRYNKVITEPLAKIGFAEQQYKMGLYFYNDFIFSFTEGCKIKGQEGLEKAIYWWKKAAAKGNRDAIDKLATAKEEKTRQDTTEQSEINTETDIDTTFQKSNNPADSVWIRRLNTIKLPKSIQQDNLINVYFKYNQIINGYEVTARWLPFHPKCETGYLIMDFRYNEEWRDSFKYVETEKYNNYNTDKVTFSKGFQGYQNGDVYYFDYISPETCNPYPEYNNNSPIGYNTPFQFTDVDFDGKEELLINDWYQGQGGNGYYVYKIKGNSIQLIDYPPFNSIDNLTKFDYENKTITLQDKEEISVFANKNGKMTLVEKRILEE
jgi:hypothetical protein